MSLIFCLFLCGLWCFTSANFGLTSTGGTELPTGRKLVQDNWFIQKLDHFNQKDTRTWKQRYQVNSEFYKTGGPVFLTIGGAYEIPSYWITNTAFMEYTKVFNALCIQLEHRFYGKSHPTDNLNATNLVYLNTEQALADLEAFIKIKNKNEYHNAKWVIFGAGYAGGLAAWSRMKYPQLVHAAVSSSGTVKSKLDYYESFMISQNVLSAHNPKCVSNIKQATMMIGDLLKTQEGANYIEEKFRLCDKINLSNDKDTRQLFQQLALSIFKIVEYNEDNIFNEHFPVSGSVDQLCYTMIDKSLGNVLDRYIEVQNNFRYTNYQRCISTYQSVVSRFSERTWNKKLVSSGDVQWFYQTCTELGNFLTTNENNKLIGNAIPLDFLTDMCADVFGKSFDLNALKKSISQINMRYHDLKTKTSRVIYLHGSSDPWKGLGLTNPEAINSTSIVIEGESHRADTFETSKLDSLQLMKARKTVLSNLKSWL